MKKTLKLPAVFAFAVVVAAGLIVSLPVWLSGQPAGSDTVFHASWYTNFSEQFRSGELYPRWLAGMNGGLGSPVFFYYAPLPYQLTSLLAPLLDAGEYGLRHLAASTALSVIASGLAAYLWLREISDRCGATVGAILYLLAPYHAVVDLFMRGAFSELWAFVWMPLVLYFARRLARDDSRLAFAGLSVTYALLILTHLPATLIFSAIPVCYVWLTAGRGRVARPLLRALAALTLGAGASAIYLLPALTMQDYAAFADMHAYNYFERWITFEKANVRDLHGQLFWGALTSAGLVVCAALSCRVRLEDAASSETVRDETVRGEAVRSEIGRGEIGRSGEGRGERIFWGGERVFWGVVAGLSILLTTFASDPVWRLLPVLQKIQFPWRFQIVLCLAVAAVVASSLGALGRSCASANRRVLVFALLLVASWVYFWAGAALRIYPEFPRAYAIGEGTRRWMDRGRDAPEYRPAWAASNAEHDIENLLIKFCGDLRRETRACVAEGTGAVSVTRRNSRELDLRVESDTGLTFRVTQFYFRGWTAQLDGHTHPLEPSRPDGLLFLNAPADTHNLRLALEPTAPERAGRIITAASALILLLWIAWPLLSEAKKIVKRR